MGRQARQTAIDLGSPGSADADPGPTQVRDLLAHAADLAIAHRAGDRPAPLRPSATAPELRALIDIDLPDDGRDGRAVIDQLAEAARPGLVGNTGPDFFAWVMGASHPVGVAADWLTSAWGQNAAIYATAPAAAIAEEAVASWLLDLLRLPPSSSVGFASGATMASFTCLAAARSAVLQKAGYDLETDGLIGALPIAVFAGEEAHTAIFSGLRYLGFGRKNIVAIATDAAGRMRADDLKAKLDRHAGPKIIVGQAGHINSGAFDPFPELAALAQAHDAWLHVDGAFGLWARAVPELAELCAGIEAADSWAVDGHKWLQVPYDSAFAIVKDADAHRRAMDTSASYIAEKPGDGRNPTQYGPELSRRARGFAAWSVFQALGRSGIRSLVRRHCDLARSFADRITKIEGLTVCNRVDCNQVAITCVHPDPEVDTAALTQELTDRLNATGDVFVRTTVWKGTVCLRISVISGATDELTMDDLANRIANVWSEMKQELASRAHGNQDDRGVRSMP
jgi:glutamate/tyrosine decarboxylase-like PLP-dependent enzyme